MDSTPKESLAASFVIGQWTVDAGLNSISDGRQTIALEPKVMAVLIYLAENVGRSVSREELEQNVWSGMVVSYDALTGTINKLRKALGDDSSRPSYIKTIPKKGYCLIAEVIATKNVVAPAVDVDPQMRMPTSRRSGRRASVLLVLLFFISAAVIWSVVPRKHEHVVKKTSPALVVLPFDDLSSDPSQNYFSNGITADITTALSKLSGIFVISSNSVINLSLNNSEDVRNIAKKFNVRYVLQGSIRRTDKRVRINAQLIDASNGVNLWAERYDREITSVLDLQDEIAKKIAEALSVELTEQEKQRQSRRYTANIEAYDLFLRGQSAYVRGNSDDNLLARDLFQAAIDKDPKFSRAYSAMALTYADEYRFRWGTDPDASIVRALELAQKAVALDDQLPQVYWVQAYIYLQKRDYPQSIANSMKTIELDPNNSDGHAMLALSRIHNGEPEAAVRLIQKAMNLNPHYPARYSSVLGQAYYYLGRYEQATFPLREASRQNLELITPRIYLIAALQKSGHHDEAAWEAGQLKVFAPALTHDMIPQMIPNYNPAVVKDIQQQLQHAGL